MEHSQLLWNKTTTFDEVDDLGILAGEDDGVKIYVGRAMDKDGNFVPAKIVPSLKTGFFSYNENEESSEDVDFLSNSGDYHWENFENADYESAAMLSGSIIGRGSYDGHLVVGRVDKEKNQLIGSYGGKTFSIPSYEVLIYKSQGRAYETVSHSKSYSSKKFSSVVYSNTSQYISNGFERKTYDESYLMSKIRQLEADKLLYLKERQNYEERLSQSQVKINELSIQVRSLKTESTRFSTERVTYEEKLTTEQQKTVSLEVKLKEFTHNNIYLLKKVSSLEDALLSEKRFVESWSEKVTRSESYVKTLLTKISSLEAIFKSQQTRIFEFESEISMTTSNSEFLLKRVGDYEVAVKTLRLQLETFIKKLDISRNDNSFLQQKLSVLTESLRKYQNQIECLTNKLHESKTVIATTHTELSHANLQVAKYQAALSSSYVLNGELMTKVSGMKVVAQNQVGSDCSSNMISYAVSAGSAKWSDYGKTSSIYGFESSLQQAPVEWNFESFIENGHHKQSSKFTKASGSVESESGSSIE